MKILNLEKLFSILSICSQKQEELGDTHKGNFPEAPEDFDDFLSKFRFYVNKFGIVVECEWVDTYDSNLDYTESVTIPFEVYEFEDVVDIELWAESQLVNIEEDAIKTLECDIKFYEDKLESMKKRLENIEG